MSLNQFLIQWDLFCVSVAISYKFFKYHTVCKGPFTRSIFKDPIFVGSENRIVWTHRKWPSDPRIRKFEKRDRNRTCSIFIRQSSWKMKGANKFCMISLWSFWRQIEGFVVSSENRSVWTHYKCLPTFSPQKRNLEIDRLNACFQFSEPRIGSLKSLQIVWTGLKKVKFI